MVEEQRRARLRKRVLVGGAILIAGAGVALLALKLTESGDPPILVGDGSITFDYSKGISQNSKAELEVGKLLHGPKNITISDYGSNTPVASYPANNRDWTITSNVTQQFQISLRALFASLGTGVIGTCTSVAGWTGNAPPYICTPGDGPQLTPATLRFNTGNCPGAASPTCPTLDCPTHKCVVRIYY